MRRLQKGTTVSIGETLILNMPLTSKNFMLNINPNANWRSGVIKKLILAIGLSLSSIPGHAQNLCVEAEAVVMSFQIKKSNKILSICKESSSTYLVYRFGVKGKIELIYPNLLDEMSWKKFVFSGRRRDGGKENAGFGDYTLSFSRGGNEYTVFQQWSYEDNSYDIGINVQTHEKFITLLGNQKTQKGSLVLLESEGKRLPNIND